MKEIVFLKQNAERWKRLELLMANEKDADPDQLAELFIQLTDDLAYAQTFYSGSKTTIYLNSLTSKYHQAIYRNKKEDKKRFGSFWIKELPLLYGKYRQHLLYSLVIFVTSIGIGVLSSANDDGFIRLILGDSYVNMTLDNIEGGDPMAVYKQANELNMFLGITINNIKVALAAFTIGVCFSFGTGIILFMNGVLMGAFHYLFYQKGLFFTSVLSIWIHGTLEVTAILLSAGAGIVIGNSILFPGTWSRANSFARGAKDGLKMFLGAIPLFIIAGFLEGFVTRYTTMPRPLCMAIIAGSLLFVIWYYVLYPVVVERSVKK
ncbi:MAG: stage II sporulation protein M [bacterium]|nr:stage II sporulation protein M [bacterium]